MVDSTALQLQLIHEISRLLTHAQIPHWLFGGWSVDLHVGVVTREHGDLEFFIWEHDGSLAEDLLDAAGYQVVDHPHPEEASVWRKQGQIVELYFNVVNAQGEVVGRGRWDHWPSPENALGSEVRVLHGVECPVVSMQCILGVKQGYAQYTGIPLREKDRADVKALRRALESAQ
ncbi:MAG: hypothetical protein M3Z66_24320 [Chloroflexota bacterium]|nr:hypothetical protein [Chloroflexota bacterium]